MGKILQRCDVCKNFHVAFVVKDPESGEKVYLCSNCWKKRYGSSDKKAMNQQAVATPEIIEITESPATLVKQPYPILEYDLASEAMIEPNRVIKPRRVPEHCVISFLRMC